MNASRFRKSSKFMVIFQYQMITLFSNQKTIIANQKRIPVYDYKQALYVRPFMIGAGHNMV